MKSLITLCTLLVSYSAISQGCGDVTPTASHTFIHDNLQFNILAGDQSFNGLDYKVSIGPDGDLSTRAYSTLIKYNNTWISAIDPNGSLKIAVGDEVDQEWSMGPLDMYGQTNPQNCQDWDRVFSVTNEEIRESIRIFEAGGSCDDIPLSVLEWPAVGNTYLPFDVGDRGADFYDANFDDKYDPCDGDYPMVYVNRYSDYIFDGKYFDLPSQISYYIINDNGGEHAISGGSALQFQVGVYVFSYRMHDLKDVVFSKQTIINRATDDARNGRYGNKIDFDLGCPENDLVGTDAANGMVYAYNSGQNSDCDINADPLSDGQIGMCYLKNNPVFYDIKIVNGDTVLCPVFYDGDGDLDTTIQRQMDVSIIPSSYSGSGQSAFCNLIFDSHFYNLMNGRTAVGDSVADNEGNVTTMMYTGDPSKPESWTLCSDMNAPKTTSISSMTLKLLQPYAKTEFVSAYMYTRNGNTSGCPSINALKYKLGLVEQFYNRGFVRQVGPPPPDIRVEKTDSGLKLVLDDIPIDYSERFIVDTIYEEGGSYHFEGIKIYQVKSQNFDMTELENTDYSRLVYQGDIQNGISNLLNYESIIVGDELFTNPTVKVNGSDEGIDEEILFDFDHFTEQPVDLDEEYYFVAVSYAYNNYEQFNLINNSGQKYQYIESTYGLKVISSETFVSNQNTEVSSQFRFRTVGQEWSIDNAQSDLQVKMISTSGQLINTWNIGKGDVLSSKGLDDLPAGLYFISIYEEGTHGSKTYKVICI